MNFLTVYKHLENSSIPKIMCILTTDDIELEYKDFLSSMGTGIDILVLPFSYRNECHEQLSQLIAITKIRKGEIIYV